MDLNPDQMVAMKLLHKKSYAVRIFDFFNRAIFRQASEVIVLDRFMGQRVLRKLDIRDKIETIPPWPHDDQLESIPHVQNAFRNQHALDGKFVVMYFRKPFSQRIPSRRCSMPLNVCKTMIACS